MGKKTRADYPDNWEKIAYSIKERDGWTCQKCGLEFFWELTGNYTVRLPALRIEGGKIRRLTVHHKDRNTKNSSPDNLISLCCSCHCKEEWPLIRRELATRKTESQVKNGQMLFWQNRIARD